MATSVKDPWKAVVIVPGDSACTAATQLRGKRFLSRNAPRLPLPECSRQDQCQCKYRHLSDRRGAQRRFGEETRIGPTEPVAKEKRRPGERRERRR
jgi:hypothetical protein